MSKIPTQYDQLLEDIEIPEGYEFVKYDVPVGGDSAISAPSGGNIWTWGRFDILPNFPRIIVRKTPLKKFEVHRTACVSVEARDKDEAAKKAQGMASDWVRETVEEVSE